MPQLYFCYFECQHAVCRYTVCRGAEGGGGRLRQTLQGCLFLFLVEKRCRIMHGQTLAKKDKDWAEFSAYECVDVSVLPYCLLLKQN